MTETTGDIIAVGAIVGRPADQKQLQEVFVLMVSPLYLVVS